jgi:hypothetical protein
LRGRHVIDFDRLTRRQLAGGLLGVAAGAVGATVLLAGDDIDPTGVGDSTTGIQARIDAAPDGAVVAIPPGAVLRCSGTVTLHGERKSLLGPGELRFVDGVAAVPALRITGDGCRVDAVTVTNPRELLTDHGDGRGVGIEIAANDVTVHDCIVDRFVYGIVVAFDGEWLDTRILGNRVTNVLGAGGGRGSDSDLGEDRGDGITVWGARATVVGNVVSAKPGADARIGIHAEGLSSARTGDAVNPESMVTITGNVVTGPFRRSIAVEGVDAATVMGNTVAGATWWGLAVIYGTGCVVSGNTVRYSRSSDDDQGRSWGPARSAVMVFAGTGHLLADNTITVSGAADAFVTVALLTGRPPTDVAISGNNCRTVGTGTCTDGVICTGEPGPVRPKVRGNTIAGVRGLGVYLGAADSPEATGNTVIGDGATRCGILGEYPANAGSLVTGNRVTGCGTGLGLHNASAGVVHGNLIENCGIGLDLFGSQGMTVMGNVFRSVATPTANTEGNQLS